MPRQRRPYACGKVRLEMRAQLRRRKHARAVAKREARSAARLLGEGHRERPPVRARACNDAHAPLVNRQVCGRRLCRRAKACGPT